ncbi:hypothetical protein KSE_16010 [Kitasatospora setae KM-6054]|uniref:Uncharacterized protein n=1 Tax=Kitasatospora setae (strain ATCC 33774 / DSM 43861 / JCM 3304 / KCC A-0304 / NBRC 14216 / KM-6054) TaxID=452652 RepID=E4N897_KITSK|nr:hypothetical protein KSE_16010 [Kitasatospora setae KM-6054]
MNECPEGPGHKVERSTQPGAMQSGPQGPVWRCLTCGRWGGVMTAEWAALFPGEPVLFPLGWTRAGSPVPIRSTRA